MGSPRPERNSLTPALAPAAEAARRAGDRRRSLRLRLVLIVAAVCAAVALSTFFDTLRDREETLALAERQHDNVAGALAEQAARALQATDLILRQAMLLDPDTPGSPDRASIPDLLSRHMSGVPQVRNLFLFDPARQLHLSTAATGAKSDLSDRSYYLAQRDQPGVHGRRIALFEHGIGAVLHPGEQRGAADVLPHLEAAQLAAGRADDTVGADHGDRAGRRQVDFLVEVGEVPRVERDDDDAAERPVAIRQPS